MPLLDGQQVVPAPLNVVVDNVQTTAWGSWIACRRPGLRLLSMWMLVRVHGHLLNQAASLGRRSTHCAAVPSPVWTRYHPNGDSLPWVVLRSGVLLLNHEAALVLLLNSAVRQGLLPLKPSLNAFAKRYWAVSSAAMLGVVTTQRYKLLTNVAGLLRVVPGWAIPRVLYNLLHLVAARVLARLVIAALTCVDKRVDASLDGEPFLLGL